MRAGPVEQTETPGELVQVASVHSELARRGRPVAVVPFDGRGDDAALDVFDLRAQVQPRTRRGHGQRLALDSGCRRRREVEMLRIDRQRQAQVAARRCPQDGA